VRAAGLTAARHGRATGSAQRAVPGDVGTNAGWARFAGCAQAALVASGPPQHSRGSSPYCVHVERARLGGRAIALAADPSAGKNAHFVRSGRQARPAGIARTALNADGPPQHGRGTGPHCVSAGRARLGGRARISLAAGSPSQHDASQRRTSDATRRLSRLAGHTPVDRSAIDLDDAERALRRQRHLAARTADRLPQYGASSRCVASPHLGGCR
jgi:hypothetical protein